jgi:cell division protein FtsZ
MSEINFDEFSAKIGIVGVGGMGSNQVNKLFNADIKSADTIAMNTDAKHLNMIKAHRKLLLGKSITRGLGSGGFVDIAAKAADASAYEIKEAINNYDLLFLCAGMGGGTGGGAGPVIAKMAKEQGALVVAFVTYPFSLERSRRDKADASLKELSRYADTTVIIENDRLLSYYRNLPMEKAFDIVDSITVNAVKGITDTIKLPSLINLDFADMRAVLQDSGAAVISVGAGSGDRNLVESAVKSTLAHPLMGFDMEGSKSALVHVTGSPALTIKDATEIAEGITSALDSSANVIFGARVVPEMNNQVYTMSIVTGIKPRLGEVEIDMSRKKEEDHTDFNIDVL